MKEEELKACPFCGSNKAKIALSEEIGQFFLVCPDCNANQGTHPNTDVLEEKWQKRPQEEKLQKEIEELKEQNKELKGKITGETSDGYHTFNELYEHRVLLWINLILLQHPKITYLVEDHYEGWFLLGCETPEGQISYHCPNKYLDLVKNVTRRQPEFDGHTSDDVVERLKKQALRREEEN